MLSVLATTPAVQLCQSNCTQRSVMWHRLVLFDFRFLKVKKHDLVIASKTVVVPCYLVQSCLKCFKLRNHDYKTDVHVPSICSIQQLQLTEHTFEL